MIPARALHVLAALGCAVLGVLLAVATTALHATGWGLVLGLAAVLASVLALPPRVWLRLPLAATWMAVIGYLAVPRSEGDYLIAGDLPGYLLLASAVVIPLICIATTRRAPSDARDGSGAETRIP